MKITIPTDTFYRLSKAAVSYGAEIRPHLACVRLEIKDGAIYAVASTSWIMAIEHVGITDQPDEHINIATSPMVMRAIEAAEDVTFESWPSAGIATMSLYNATIGAVETMPDIEPMFTRWFDFVAKASTKDKGFIYIEADKFRALIDSSPSGHIVFPAFIDNSRVIYLRDRYDENWLGLFLSGDKDKEAQPATIPEWLP